MKKLFLLISVLALSLMAGAKTINITPTSPHSSGNNLLATLSDESTVDGDVIILADGTYSEYNNYIVFDKSVEVKAADGAHPVVEVECEVRIGKNASNKNVTIRGIKFDGSKQDGTGNNPTSYSHFFRIYSAGTLDFENCEFYNSANKVMEVESTSSVASLVVNNCYFHDNTKNCISIENTVASDLTVTNSTFANCSTTSKGTIFSKAAASSVIRVDHCTFYDCTTESTDYGVIGHNGFLPTDVVVSNCIFAWSTTYDKRATYLPSGTSVTNCLTYNTSKDTGTWGHHSGPTFTSCSLQDPLFDDLENDKYTYAGDWTTMDLSPARGAATDGSDLGDPRWYSNEVLPSVNFASDYNLVGAKALLTGNIELNESSHIKYTGSSTPGVATWKMHITKKCVINAVADREAESTSGCELTLTVYNAEGDEVSTISAAASHNDNDINFNGSLFIPGEGDYTFKLTNATSWSGAILEKIILSYVGGDVQNMPGTTDIDDAWFSSNGTRTAGEDISIPAGHQDEGWVKWNVAFASAGNYNVTVTIDNENGHNYTVALYEDEDDESPITLSEGGQKSTIGTIELGAMEVPAGNYIMKVTNATQYSDAKLVSVTFAYAGGGVIEFGKSTAGSLLANADAIVSDDWSIEGGKITHDESKALTGWAKWNVDCQDYGNYNVTVNISSDNGHLVRVEIFENEAESAIYTLDETSSTQYHTGDQAIDLGNIVLDDREYVVKVSNTGAYSHVQIASIVITYLNGARATLPATCTFSDLMLSAKAHITESNLWFNTIGDSNPVGQWAKWNVKVASAGTFLFTMNVSSTNGQSYKISILDMDENELDAFESGSVGSGDKTVKNYFNLAAGNYIVKLENTYSWSQGHISSLVVTQPSLITIDEAATSNSVIHDNCRDGNHDIQITRTITPGMYNTICLPFDVPSAQLKAIFGSDVTLLEMSTASLSGDELTLAFTDALEGGIYRGTPYLIKTTKTISNPVFTDVEIKAEAGSTTAGTGADFIGTFIKNTIDANEYNLFLGSGDKLYFSNNDVTLKGMRAYFQIKNNGTGAPVRKARIVEQNKIVTELELIDGEWQDIKSANGIIKTIENGQLILIRDGKRYNVMGIRF